MAKILSHVKIIVDSNDIPSVYKRAIKPGLSSNKGTGKGTLKVEGKTGNRRLREKEIDGS